MKPKIQPGIQVKRIKIENTTTGQTYYKDVTEEQYQALLLDRSKRELPLRITVVTERCL